MAAGGGTVEAGGAVGDILIVDDEEDIREFLSMLLEKHGYRVRTSANGKEAVAAIERAPPALILLDLMMPVMSGWELVDWVKNDRAVSAEQVVVMSACDSQCPSGLPFVHKPFETTELLAAIRERVG